MAILTSVAPSPVATRGDAGFGGDLLRVLNRQRVIIVAVVVIVTGLATLFALLWPPVYRATSSIIVATNGTDSRLGSDVLASAAQDENRVLNQVQLLGGRELAQAVVKELNLLDDPEFNPLVAAQPSAAATKRSALESVSVELRDRLAVRRVGRSAVILITASSQSAAKAARLADAVVMTHLRLLREEQASDSAATAALFDAQIVTLREEVIAADRKVVDYRRRHNILGAAEAPDLSQYEQLAGSLVDARSSRSEAAARSDGATLAARDGRSTSTTSALLTDLRRQSAELGKRVAELSAFYGRGYPEYGQAEAQLADIDRRIAAEAVRIDDELRAAVEISRAREGQIRGDLDSLRSQTYAQRTASVTLLDLQRSADASRARYVALLARSKQFAGEAEMKLTPVKQLARAAVPDKVAFPRSKEIIGVALVGSFVLGLILAYAVELLHENRVRTADQVNRLLGVPTLGMIPSLRGEPPVHRTLVDEPGSLFSEAVRSLCLDVLQQLPTAGSPIILVTSPLPHDGKTTVALCLGASAAGLWRKVAVIDFDLHRPDLLTAVGQAGGVVDLVSYLNGEAGLDDIIVADDVVMGLSLIGVRQPAANPAALLASPRLRELFEQLRSRFDLIVVNTPPILAVRDAKTLSAFVDASLLVLRWGRSRNDAVLAAARAFGTPFAGVVINRVDIRRHAAAAYGDAVQHYSACSSYYSSPEAGRRAA